MTAAPPESPPEDGAYRCGTLVYTWPKLALVFAWLMVGGMVYSVCLQLPLRLLPLQLRELGISDTHKMVILGTIGGVMNMTVCPWVGFVSDRHRSRWGRRIPFILRSLPPLCLALVLFAFTDRIGAWLSEAATGIIAVAPGTMTAIVIGAVMILFQFYYMYVGSVIYYIFNDVIPPRFFGRVMGAFQLASTAGLAAFNFFVFGHAAEYYSTIFIAGAVLYALGMGAMCLMVKEGEYAPITGEEEARAAVGWTRRLAGLRIFARESLAHRFYLLRYALTAVFAIATLAATLQYYFYLEAGLDNRLIGRLDGTIQLAYTIAIVVVTATASFLIDRWHPFRIYIYQCFLFLATAVDGLRWLFGSPTPTVFLYSMIILTVAGALWNVLANIANLPMQMLTFPKSRFGSFCSAQALLRSLATTVAGVFVGLVFDALRGVCGGGTFHYRFVPVWPLPWAAGAAVLAYFTYREWGALGGYGRFRTPAPWTAEGVEPVEQPEVRPPGAAMLRWAVAGVDLLIAATLVLTAVFALKAAQAGGFAAARPFLMVNAPLALLAAGVWIAVRTRLGADVRRCLAGETPRGGIPHPGPLLLILVMYFTNIGLYAWQMATMPGGGRAAFLAIQPLGVLALVGVIGVLRRMERGIVTEIAVSRPPPPTDGRA